MNENTTNAPAALVAIDWSDQKHDIALLPAGAERAEYSQLPLAGPDLTTRLACDLILRWPDLASLQRAKVQTLRRFFYARNFRHPKMLDKRLEALQAALPLCEDIAIIGAGRLKAIRLARALLALLPAIKQYDQQIADLFNAHDDAAIFASFPGAGPALAPRLLVTFGSRRDRWRHSLDLATFSGIAPVIEQSGKRSIVHWRWACPKFVRQSLHEFARCSLRFCSWAKRFYQTQRARGKNHHGAVRALAFKWIRILFRCWQDRCLYDPAKYAPANL